MALKNDIMEKRLKQSLGIDVSKLGLSLSLRFLTEKLGKKFKSHADLRNDLWGYKEVLKWLKKSVHGTVVDLLIVMEATGSTIRVSPIICTHMAMRLVKCNQVL